jgi:hypothetical protein
MIYLCGDIHGKLDIAKILNWEEKNCPNENDILIILGDFGAIWYGNEKDNMELTWWENKPYTILFLDGNHENHIAISAYPEVELYCGRANKIRENIYHLKRGEIFTIEGKTFFVMGGAKSIDRYARRENIDWWPQEMPTKEEYDYALDKLANVDWEVDYILTHCTDNHTLWLINHHYDIDTLTKFLSFIKDEYNLKYKHHYFGHYHIDEKLTSKETCLYNTIIKL